MNRFFKIVGTLVLVAVLCAASLIGLVEYSRWRDERNLDALVAALPPGTPFSVATERLGQPKQIVVDPGYMSAVRRFPTQTLPGPKLNMFWYREYGAIWWVLVFTDADSKTIRHAEWNAM